MRNNFIYEKKNKIHKTLDAFESCDLKKKLLQC